MGGFLMAGNVMDGKHDTEPDSTAARVASLWRALHAEADVTPHVLEDTVGLQEANAETLRQVASFASGSTFAVTFLCPMDMVDPDVRPGLEMAEKGARTSGTPFISYFTPQEVQALAMDSGFKEARHVSSAALGPRYFAGREDGLRPPDNAAELLVARI